MQRENGNSWWTERTHIEMAKLGDLRSPGFPTKLRTEGPDLSAETLVAVIRRHPEDLPDHDEVVNTCIGFLFYPPQSAKPDSAGYVLSVRVLYAARRVLGRRATDDDYSDFFQNFVRQHLLYQILSRDSNRILEERFWFRVKRRLARFARAQKRRRALAGMTSVPGTVAPMWDGNLDRETTPDSPEHVLAQRSLREAVERLPEKLRDPMLLWLQGYPITARRPSESISGKLGVRREIVHRRVRKAQELLAKELDLPVSAATKRNLRPRRTDMSLEDQQRAT